MKANELMIGDWVFYKYSAPEEWQPRRWRIVSYEKDFISLADPSVCCKPIPLTEEILKANGFATSEGFAFTRNSRLKIDIDITNQINIQIISENGCSIYAKFKYVHELQHALRLCGLNELADNFKLKADVKD